MLFPDDEPLEAAPCLHPHTKLALARWGRHWLHETCLDCQKVVGKRIRIGRALEGFESPVNRARENGRRARAEVTSELARGFWTAPMPGMAHVQRRWVCAPPGFEPG